MKQPRRTTVVVGSELPIAQAATAQTPFAATAAAGSVARSAAHRRHIVEAAEAFLRDHISAPVSIPQLCRVTGVCERTLRNAFYDVLGMSPKQFMLRARLDEVHEALRRRDTQIKVTVTTVATAYGFNELGRFAGQYKAVFGEYPSDTLHQPRNSALPRQPIMAA